MNYINNSYTVIQAHESACLAKTIDTVLTDEGFVIETITTFNTQTGLVVSVLSHTMCFDNIERRLVDLTGLQIASYFEDCFEDGE
jgi:hypothetical protein